MHVFDMKLPSNFTFFAFLTHKIPNNRGILSFFRFYEKIYLHPFW